MSNDKNAQLDQTGVGISGGNVRDVEPIVNAAGRDNSSTQNQPKANAEQSQGQSQKLSPKFFQIQHITSNTTNDDPRVEPRPETHRSSSDPLSVPSWLVGRKGNYTPEEALIYLPGALEKLEITVAELQRKDNSLSRIIMEHEKIVSSYKKELTKVREQIAEGEIKLAETEQYKNNIIKDLETELDVKKQLLSNYEDMEIKYLQLRCELLQYQTGDQGISGSNSHTPGDNKVQKQYEKNCEELNTAQEEMSRLREQEQQDRAEKIGIEAELQQAEKKGMETGDAELKKLMDPLYSKQTEIQQRGVSNRKLARNKLKQIAVLEKQEKELLDRMAMDTLGSSQRESASSQSSIQGLTDGASAADRESISTPPPSVATLAPHPDKRSTPTEPLRWTSGLLANVPEEQPG